MIVRRLVVILGALLLGAQVVRNAAVDALAPLEPATAARFWAGNPSVEISLGLAQIGYAARQRKPIDPHTFAMIDDAARKAPLSPEPFVVRGVRAQIDRDGDTARRAFLAAQWRDPRSLPAAYFLADYYFRAGKSLRGLEQTALLVRLSPEGTSGIATAVAVYAQNRANWPEIRALFRSQPAIEDSVLTALAQDPRNADAILAVADVQHRQPDSSWLPVLLQSLIGEGDYARARTIWAAVGGGQVRDQLLYDADFSSSKPPPPFNWILTSSTVGLAERQPGKRLHAIFYGNEDGVLASELLILPPGTYRLQMQMVGAPVRPEALLWSIRCDKSHAAVGSANLNQAAAHGLTFTIPPSCPAQWIELRGRSGDIAQQSEATITGLRLTRVGSHA